MSTGFAHDEGASAAVDAVAGTASMPAGSVNDAGYRRDAQASTPGSVPPATPPTTRSRATDLALVAVMAGLVAVCAVAPPVPTGIGVPITLQTFGVLLTGLVLGARRGAAAVALYLLVGLAGMPVFAGGTGGPGVLAGPTVGYLVGFVPAAAVAGVLAGVARRAAPRWRPTVLAGAALVAGLLVVHPLGIAGLVARVGLPVRAAVAADLVFVPGDAVKALVAAAVAVGVLRAFPSLLRER